MKKWKRQNEKEFRPVLYLYFKEDEVKEITVSDWSFEKAAAGYLFKCYVKKENCEAVDKIWTVWDYESAQILRKKLGVKYTSGTKDLKVKMLVNEDEEKYFELVK